MSWSVDGQVSASGGSGCPPTGLGEVVGGLQPYPEVSRGPSQGFHPDGQISRYVAFAGKDPVEFGAGQVELLRRLGYGRRS